MQATWPPHETWRLGPFTLRDGRCAGRRASAATAEGPVTEADIAQAARAMVAMGQPPLFGCLDTDRALSRALEAAGFKARLAVDLWVAPTAQLAALDLPRMAAFDIWPPLAIIRDIWAETGVGPARQAVMDRAPRPKTAILTRAEARPVGAAFVACDGPVAMVHALVTRPAGRGRGAARHAMLLAARWAAERGAAHLGLAVTADNAAAARLYAKLGMRRPGGYHYRSLTETTA
jgi:GNAT superfamily N-acetyltransferase